MPADCKWTVYVHTCSINGKSYVGITSKKPERRWGTDGNGYKGQAFYSAIEKYGWDNFTHSVVAEGLTEEDAKIMEISLIECFGSHISKNGYNVTLGGDGYLGVDNHGNKNPMYGKHHSDETKEKIRAIHKGKATRPAGWHHSEEAKKKMSDVHKNRPPEFYDHLRNIDHVTALQKAKEKNMIPVCQYDRTLSLIKRFDCAMDAERETGVDHSAIASCCRHKSNTAGGYFWLYESDIYKIDEMRSELLFSLNNKNKLLYGKQILQFDLSLNLIGEYDSIHDASKITGVDRSGISDVCSGELKTSGGYVWRYRDSIEDIDSFRRSYIVDTRRRGKSVVQLDNDMNVIAEYVSTADAAKSAGVSRTCIGKSCNGKQKSAGGYIWRFSSDIKTDENEVA